jgi:hypothetical protein
MNGERTFLNRIICTEKRRKSDDVYDVAYTYGYLNGIRNAIYVSLMAFLIIVFVYVLTRGD